MAFSRRAWEAVGGFPEHQYAGEDLAFAAAILDYGYSVRLAPKAMVHWSPPATWRANALMFFRYCRGDVRSKGRSRHVARIVAWITTPLVLAHAGRRGRLAVLPRRAGLHRAAARASPTVGDPRDVDWWRIPVAAAVKDMAQVTGALRGSSMPCRGSRSRRRTRLPHPTPARPQRWPAMRTGRARA